MAKRWQRGIVVGALGCVLLAGCAAPQQGAEDGANEAAEDRRVEAHAHYAQGMIYEMDGDRDNATEEFYSAAMADPSNEELVLDLVRQFTEGKQPAKALELLSAAAAEPGASTTVLSQLALAYAQAGKNGQAIATARKVVQREPDSLTGYEDLFLVYLQEGRVQDALKSLNQASKVKKADATFLINLAGLYASLQTASPSVRPAAITNGLALLDRAVLPDPPDPQLSLKRADAYNLLGAETKAEQIYLQLLDKYGALSTLRDDLNAKLADLYLRGHNGKKAEARLKAILEDDPANSQVYYYLGNLAYDERRLPEAIDYYQKSVGANEDFEQAYYDLAGAQINDEHPREALATLEKARAKFSTNFMGEFFTALAYVKLKEYTNAVGHFAAAEASARSGTNHLTGYFYFEAGAACERNGEYARASEYFEKSLKLAPDLAEALNYYGYMLADRGEKLEKARGMIEKAVQLDPTNAAYLDSLGWVLFKQGKPADGLTQVQKAIDLSNDDPDATLYEHLGDIYAALKEPDKARAAWKKSLSLEPNAEVRRKLGPDAGDPAGADPPK